MQQTFIYISWEIQGKLILLGNPRKTVYDLFLNTPIDKYNKDIYLQLQKLFSLRDNIFKKLTNKGIINNDFDQSSIVKQKYKKSIAKKKTRTRIKTKISGIYCGEKYIKKTETQ